MTFNLTAQAGSCRGSCGVAARTYRECPAPARKTTGAPSHSFGGVLKAADITSVRLGSAQCGIAQPRLTLTGQRDDTAGAAFLRFVGTGGRRDGRCMSILDSRKPHAEKVLQDRSRQKKMASEPDACAGVGSPLAGNANHHRLQCASGH